MLTDDEIKERLQRAGYTSGPFYEDPRIFSELCNRLLAAEAEAETLRRNNDVLRADLLDVMRDRDEAQARVKVLEDALRRIANTTEGDADLDEYGSAEVARAALQEQSK
jgi:hypothetical protein